MGTTVEADDFIVNAEKWNSTGRRGPHAVRREVAPPSEEAVLAASGLAASLGVADLFKRAIGHDRLTWIPDFTWNLWSHESADGLLADDREIEKDLNLGKTLLAGVGAIGSALVYLLDMLPLRGELTLLDRDHVETSNLNRSPLFTAYDVLSTTPKIDVAAKYLSHHGNLTATTIEGTWHERSVQIRNEPFDLWISFTNEDGAWAEMPFQLPPVILQGTTTSGWGFGAGRHIPRREDCTYCRLPRPEIQFRGPCAEGDVQPEGPSARASLPFLSAASASLVMADLIKLASGSAVDCANEVSADVKIGLPSIVALQRLKSPTCRGCRALDSQLWIDRGGRGRYRDLSL